MARRQSDTKGGVIVLLPITSLKLGQVEEKQKKIT
jgi:hypothetical protein